MSTIYRTPPGASLQIAISDCCEDGLFFSVDDNPDAEEPQPTTGYLCKAEAFNLYRAIGGALGVMERIVIPKTTPEQRAELDELIRKLPATGLLSEHSAQPEPAPLNANERTLEIIEAGFRDGKLTRLPRPEETSRLLKICTRATVSRSAERTACIISEAIRWGRLDHIPEDDEIEALIDLCVRVHATEGGKA